MHKLYLLSVWLHLLAMATWLGGMLFLAVVVLPILRRGEPAQLGVFMSRAAPRLRAVGWVCLIMLGVTGLIQLHVRGQAFTDGLILVKLLVFGAILVISLVHDFWLGPLASAAMRDRPGDPATLRHRKVALGMGRVTALLGLVAFTLGVFLVRGTPW